MTRAILPQFRHRTNLPWLGFLTHGEVYPCFSFAFSVFWHSKDNFRLISIDLHFVSIDSHMGVSYNRGIPRAGFHGMSYENRRFGGTPISGNVHIFERHQGHGQFRSQHPILAPLDPCIPQEAKLLVTRDPLSFPGKGERDIIGMYIYICDMFIYTYNYIYIYMFLLIYIHI